MIRKLLTAALFLPAGALALEVIGRRRVPA